MSKVITFDKGSKRRLKQIRWKIGEIITLALFTLLAIAVTALAVLWEIRDTQPYSDPPKAPQIKETEPGDP
jgi:uncharacterized protein YpmS